MTRTIASLLFLLAVQLLLSAILYWPASNSADPSGPLVTPATILTVDRIDISDDQGALLTLHKRQGRWLLPQAGDVPANPEAVNTLLEVLGKRSPGFPVGTSPAARQRFQVSSYLHQRAIALYAHDAHLATVYLGSSPGYRKVHARRADREQVYSLSYAHHTSPATASAWLDPSLLQMQDIDHIALGDVQLHRIEGRQWRSANGEAPDTRELAALLELLENLRVQGLAREPKSTEGPQTKLLRQLQIKAAGQHIGLSLLSLDGKALLRDSRYPGLFVPGERQVRRLLTLDTKRLAGTSDNTSRTGPAAQP